MSGNRGASLMVLAIVLAAGTSPGTARAETGCRAALEGRIKQCADDCLARARAAVDPEVRGRILGYGCSTNCAKLEMFNGHTCPAR